MHAELSRLPDADLRSRLGALLSEERKVLTDFLVHLNELDRRQLYAELGYASLFDYCTCELKLLKGAAYRRITAARLLGRFPQLEGHLREGRLCLTTVTLLKDVITEANADEVLAKAAHRTKEEVEAMVAELSPEQALPPDSIRAIGSGVYRVDFTVGEDFMRELFVARDALSHKVPHGRLEDVFKEGLEPARRDPVRVDLPGRGGPHRAPVFRRLGPDPEPPVALPPP